MIFLNGNTDLVTRILEFVAETSEELNTCAMISQVFRLSRDDSRFDQTRTGTIILKTSPENVPPEVWQRWDQQVFTGNRVRLVAILTQLPHVSSYSPESLLALTSVRELMLHRHSSVKVPESAVECEQGGEEAVRFFKKILPNLDILDIGALAGNTSNLLCLNARSGVLHDLRISVFCCTAEVSYRECHFRVMEPYLFRVDTSTMPSLREIHIDPFGVYLHNLSPPIAAYCQEYSQLEQEEWFDRFSHHNNRADWLLLQEYPNLERVTLKNADYYTFDDLSRKELPQEALMKFARQTPKLRWFCSDLTEENIASLKKERPEVEFCN